MLLMTAIYFHTWFEKFTGLVTALLGWYAIYIVPRFVPPLRALHSVVLSAWPGAKTKLAYPIPYTTSASSHRRPRNSKPSPDRNADRRPPNLALAADQDSAKRSHVAGGHDGAGPPAGPGADGLRPGAGRGRAALLPDAGGAAAGRGRAGAFFRAGTRRREAGLMTVRRV
ncbi:hypothetical protein CDD83_5998 [Cordyceps sp. RAO-2017]|nr:hypothetical protein CDD83_5998 [Cordyceps sp. RAO-2017]